MEGLPSALLQLAAQRHEEAALAREINANQSTCQAVLAASSDAATVWSQHDKLRELYERAYKMAAEEARLASEVLAGSRAVLRRRVERKNSASMARSASSSNMLDVEEADGSEVGSEDDEPIAQHRASTTRNLPQLSRYDKLNIWWHDHTSVLPIGSEVAALTDAHSIPPLWIQCKVNGYRPGPRPRYEVIDEDAGGDPEADADPESSTAAPGGGASGGGAAPAPRQKRYWLDARKILPLPSLVDVPLNKRKEFPKGARVIAVFPTGGITTLYPAEVVAPPKKRKNNEYLLLFDDDEDCQRAVNAQFVAPMPEMLSAEQ